MRHIHFNIAELRRVLYSCHRPGRSAANTEHLIVVPHDKLCFRIRLGAIKDVAEVSRVPLNAKYKSDISVINLDTKPHISFLKRNRLY